MSLKEDEDSDISDIIGAAAGSRRTGRPSAPWRTPRAQQTHRAKHAAVAGEQFHAPPRSSPARGRALPRAQGPLRPRAAVLQRGDRRGGMLTG